MLLPREKLIGTPILSLQTGAPLAQTSDILIDPRRLHITAFYCDGPLVNEQPALLHTSDIREFSDIGFIVDSSDDIMPPDGLVRLQEIIDFGFDLLHMKVVDSHQKKLGKVVDFSVESNSFMIKKITVKRPLLHSLNDSELIIDREQIVEITDDTIIVRAPSIESHEVSAARQPIVNPFRKHDPQIEGSSRNSFLPPRQ